MASLTILKGAGAGTCVDLTGSVSVEIGRRPEDAAEEGHQSLALEDPRASRAHCRIERTPEGWVLTDLGSSNGTTVGGRRVTKTFLAPGDRIRVGGTLLEWRDALVVEPLRDSDAIEETERPELSGGPRRIAGLILSLGAMALIAVLGYALLSGLGGDPAERAAESEPAGSQAPPDERTPVVSASAPTVGAGQLQDSTDVDPAIEVVGEQDRPAPPDPSVEVESILRSGDYRRALGYLDEIVVDYPELDVSAPREGILRKAREELEAAREELERRVEKGQLEEARTVLIDLAPRVPLSLSDAMTALFDAVEVADARRVAEERIADSEPRERFRKALDVLLSTSGTIRQMASATPREWTALRDEVAKLVREEIDNVLYPRHREKIAEVFLLAERSLREGERRSRAFHATETTWQVAEGAGEDDGVTLVYEFTAASELEDFRLLPGEGSRCDIDRGALRLRGECRLLSGDPFRDRLVVRGDIVAGGFDPEAPNLNVALFTSERDRLSSPTGKVRSLLQPAFAGPGGPPADFVLFGIGYRAAVAEYAGRFVEELRLEGRDAPIPFPAHVILAGRRGERLHSDPREPLWAATLGGALPRAPRFEVGIDGNRAHWTLQGRPVLPADPTTLERLEADRARLGSVTWVTYSSEVRFQRLEIQGTLRRSWLLRGVEDEARAAFDAVEAAARAKAPIRE